MADEGTQWWYNNKTGEVEEGPVSAGPDRDGPVCVVRGRSAGTGDRPRAGGAVGRGGRGRRLAVGPFSRHSRSRIA